MAYGSSYVLPERKSDKFFTQTSIFLEDYLIPLIKGYATFKMTKMAIVALSSFFDPDLSEFYYNPDPLWLA